MIDRSKLEEMRPRLMGYAMKLTRNEDDAKDLVQETIAKAMESEYTYVSKFKMIEWLGTILHHIFYDYKRKEKRYPHLPLANYDRIVEPSQFNHYFLKEISALVTFPLEPTEDIFTRRELKERFVGRQKLNRWLDEERN